MSREANSSAGVGPSRRTFLKVTTAACVGATLAGCIGDNPEEFVEVLATEDSFDPDEALVVPGGMVSWRNTSSETHHLVSVDGMWDVDYELHSEGEDGDVFAHEFESQGEYTLVCTNHGDAEEFTGMSMTITVEGDEIS